MEEVSIYKNKNQEIFYNSDLKLLNSVWIAKENLSEEEHRLEFTYYFEMVMKYKPKIILVDATNANRAISVETQNWVVRTHFAKYLEIGLKKLAILMSNNATTSISIVQTIEEYDEKKAGWETKYFFDRYIAIEWLKV